jgi:opacity protein-like surface antigen
MISIRRSILVGLAIVLVAAATHADYQKGDVMFQIYGGGAALGGRYHQPGVNKDEQDYADSGGVIGGQFLYYVTDSPCLALGFDVSHTSFDSHDSNQLIPTLFTQSSADNTTGVFVARLVYPKGRVRPYIQGGLGAHHTSLTLNGTPTNPSGWNGTGAMETRALFDDGHIGPAVEGAIGVHVYVTTRFFVGVEYKVIDLIGKDFTPTAAGQLQGLTNTDGTVSESAIGLMLGFGF